MEMNERDEQARQEIERLSKEATATFASLMTRLAHLECVRPEEIQKSYRMFRDSMDVLALDVLACCKMPYSQYLQSDRWKVVAEKRKAIDNYRCRECGDSEFLSVHHVTYENRGLESLEDLVTLCDECHRARHGKR